MITTILLACIAGVVNAQTIPSIRLYADPAFTQCTLSDTAPGVVTVYAALYAFDADGVRFRVAASPGFTGVWLSDATPYFKVGSSPTDLSVAFGKCLVGINLVATFTYQLFGTSTCSDLATAAPVGFPFPYYDTCGFTGDPLSPASLHVNCSGSFDCIPVATEPTTWGRVKALYRN
jgi:hypothetical protein